LAEISYWDPATHQAYFTVVKGTVSRDFLLLVFFLESVSPKPLIIPLGLFQIFSKNSWRYLPLKGLPPVSTTPVANGKNLQAEQFI
jgi:hypothetical protein